MLSKYILTDPISWLTDGENPAVRYLTKKEIINIQDLEQIYEELLKSELTDFFKLNYKNGVLGDFDHPDIFYRGSVWYFLLAVESGYNNKTEFITSTADNICSKTQLNNGGFKFNFKYSQAVGCRTGNMISALLKCGISDSRIINGLQWIIENQRKDGGWLHCPVAGFCDVMKLVFSVKSGDSLKHETDENVKSCPVASYTCLKALIESENDKYSASIYLGAEFFTNNNFFIESTSKLLCGNNVNFKKLGYPVMSQYDYLSGLIALSKIKNSNLNGELFNNIIKLQNNDGSWSFENRSDGMIKEKHGKSRWTTLNALRFIIPEF